MIRKLLVVSMAFGLTFSTLACTSSAPSATNARSTAAEATQPAVQTTIKDGSYPVQQATYDDGSGEYALMLIDTPAGTPPLYRATNLQMARLTDEEVKTGKKPYLKVESNQPVFYLSEDFRIEYVHNVAETQTNPQTGQQETVVVRRESNFWSPFAGAIAGQVVGNMLFAPRYYVPPVYSPGRAMTGYGGYGNSYNDAVGSYRNRYNAPPAAVKNQQTFRTTGQVRRSPSYGTGSAATKSPSVNQGNRSTGSGYGSTDLRRSNNPTRVKRSTGSFGSGGARRSGGRRR